MILSPWSCILSHKMSTPRSRSPKSWKKRKTPNIFEENERTRKIMKNMKHITRTCKTRKKTEMSSERKQKDTEYKRSYIRLDINVAYFFWIWLDFSIFFKKSADWSSLPPPPCTLPTTIIFSSSRISQTELKNNSFDLKLTFKFMTWFSFETSNESCLSLPHCFRLLFVTLASSEVLLLLWILGDVG